MESMASPNVVARCIVRLYVFKYGGIFAAIPGNSKPRRLSLGTVRGVE